MTITNPRQGYWTATEAGTIIMSATTETGLRARLATDDEASSRPDHNYGAK